MRRKAMILGLGMISMLPQASFGGIITTGCASSTACTMTELFAGGSIQLDTLLFSDWSLANSAFNLDPVGMEEGDSTSSKAQIQMFQNSRVLNAGKNYNAKMTFDFKVTNLNGTITGIDTDLRYGFVDGYWYDSPLLRVDTWLGTSIGGSDLGHTWDQFDLNHQPNTGFFDIPDSNSIWVRTRYRVDGNSNWAEGGWNPKYGFGPVYETNFFHEETENSSVPEPASLSLFTVGLVGLAFSALATGRRKGMIFRV